MREPTDALLTISAVAREVGVSPQTLRHWEQDGLVVPQRTAGGQRRYNAADLARARQIAAMRRRHGWNVAAIRTSLSEAADGHSGSLGQQLRRARRSLRLSQREAAERIGVPLDLLRAIERDEQAPSIQLVSRIANAYLLPMSALAPDAGDGRRVVRAGERPRTVNQGGVTWEELSRPGHRLEPAVLIVPAGQGSGGPYSRRGTTFAFVLSGRLTVTVGEPAEEFSLQAGDAITIEPSMPFSWRNPQRRPTRVLWVEELGSEAWSTEAASLLLERHER